MSASPRRTSRRWATPGCRSSSPSTRSTTSGRCRDVERVKQSDYFPGIWATNVVGGTLYGIPWYVDTRVLFYRSDILAAVGFPHGPRTWAEWREAMQRIQRSEKEPLGDSDADERVRADRRCWRSRRIRTLLNADGTRGAFSQPQFARRVRLLCRAFSATASRRR